MARPLRVELPGALYHVTARGNERKPVYRDAEDRGRFLERLAGVGCTLDEVIEEAAVGAIRFRSLTASSESVMLMCRFIEGVRRSVTPVRGADASWPVGDGAERDGHGGLSTTPR